RRLTPDILTQFKDAAISKAQQDLVEENGWSVDLHGGSYGTDYLERATLTAIGFGTNVAADAIYPHTEVDAAGNHLNGNNPYVIHFAPGQLPAVHGFWSLTVYDENGFLVANPIQRYSAG